MRWAYLILVSGLALDFIDASLEPTDFFPSDFPLFSGRAGVNLVDDDGPDDEHGKNPAADEDRDEWPEGSAPQNRDDGDYPWYSEGD